MPNGKIRSLKGSTMSDKHTAQQDAYANETTTSSEQLAFRRQLQELFAQSDLPDEDKMFNLGLFMRSSTLVKLLALDELYRRVVDLPGSIMEFGVWWGQNLVVYENLRAIHEPFNKQRRIVGFDTFTGYAGFGDRDKQGEIFNDGTYSTSADHQQYLSNLLEVHEGINVLGHMRGCHELVAGDITSTAPAYFERHPETLVAMAYLDVGLYEPTRAALQAIKPHLVPGSILVLDELTFREAPGEAIAFKEVFGTRGYRLEKCKLMPLKSIAVIE